MRVGPCTAAPLPISVPSPISTPAPTTANGPTRTPWASTAPGQHSATGWTRLVIDRNTRRGVGDGPRSGAAASTVYHGRREDRFGYHLAVDQRLAREAAMHGAVAQHLDLVADLVAGDHRAAELRLLDADEIDQLAGAVR